MKLICILVVGIFSASFRAQAQADLVNTKVKLANGIYVTVDDGVITIKDVLTLVEPALDLLGRQYGQQSAVYKQKEVEVWRDGTDKLVENELILRDFKNAGYALPESIIDEQVQEAIKVKYGDRRTLTQTLHAEGKTYESFRRQVREDLIVHFLRNKNISSEILISPFKIEQYYAANHEQFKMEDQVKLRRIDLNQTSGSAPGQARKLADDIHRQLEAGASFKQMAALYSEGSQRAQEGDWGWVERSKMIKELADVAFALKPGARSGVIETPEYCYIILVEETKPAHLKDLSEVRDEI